MRDNREYKRKKYCDEQLSQNKVKLSMKILILKHEQVTYIPIRTFKKHRKNSWPLVYYYFIVLWKTTHFVNFIICKSQSPSWLCIFIECLSLLFLIIMETDNGSFALKSFNCYSHIFVICRTILLIRIILRNTISVLRVL